VGWNRFSLSLPAALAPWIGLVALVAAYTTAFLGVRQAQPKGQWGVPLVSTERMPSPKTGATLEVGDALPTE